jgi:hypothetical protein
MMADRKRGTAATKKNERHASDFYYVVQISIYLLKPIGVWPLADDEATSRLKSAMHRTFTVTATFFLTFLIVLWILHLIKENWNVVLILRMICPLFFIFTIYARYILLMLHQDQLKSCLHRVVNDWQCAIIAEDHEIMLTNARVGRIFVSVIIMFSCGTFYYLLPMVSPSLIKDNITAKVHPSPCELLVFDSKVKRLVL